MTTSNKMVIGILAAVVIVTGIGYAAITGQVLNITGTLSAAATDSEFNVKFTKAEKASGNDGTVTARIDGEKAATFSVSGLKVKGERAEATYTIKNESAEGIAANIETTLTATNKEYFDVTVEGPEKAIINPREETTVTVIAELIKTPITAQTANVTVQLEATPEEAGTSTGASTFEFKIDGQTYQAEEGMTWEEWIFSDYNKTWDNTRYFAAGPSYVCLISFDEKCYLLQEMDTESLPVGEVSTYSLIKDSSIANYLSNYWGEGLTIEECIAAEDYVLVSKP